MKSNAYKVKGELKKTKEFLERAGSPENVYDILVAYGKKGVDILSIATPVRTGKTAASWAYGIDPYAVGIYTIYWYNTNMARPNLPVVSLLINGHANRNGTYYRGIDFVTPAISVLLDELADDAWKGVVNYERKQ